MTSEERPQLAKMISGVGDSDDGTLAARFRANVRARNSRHALHTTIHGDGIRGTGRTNRDAVSRSIGVDDTPHTHCGHTLHREREGGVAGRQRTSRSAAAA